MISELKEQFNIKPYDYPLDIFEICERILNVDILAVPFKTPDLRGMVSIARNDEDKHIILVNSNKSREEQNFHGFHELIHIPTADKPGTTLNCFDKVKPNQDSYLEWLANEGAAEMAVPYKILLPMIKSEIHEMLIGNGTWAFCEKHASDFGVSPIVLQNRIDSLKYEIQQYLNGIPLDQLEILSISKQKKRGIVVKSLVDLENERMIQMWNSERAVV